MPRFTSIIPGQIQTFVHVLFFLWVIYFIITFVYQVLKRIITIDTENKFFFFSKKVGIKIAIAGIMLLLLTAVIELTFPYLSFGIFTPTIIYQSPY